MKILFMFMTINSMVSTLLNHPISLGSMLMIQSILTSINLIFMAKNSWYSLILFVTFSSGIMIMFMYMSSITSNEKFKPSMKMMILYLIMMVTLTILNIKLDLNLIFNIKLTDQLIYFQENEEKISIIKNISNKKIYLTTLLTLIILMVLIAISNLINSFEGPLKMN
uniref:NADH dehydrogenase subunit 6 n=1 Tax=Epeurysa nawaii TaxID=1308479 RepID=A0A7S5DBY7_9HEMI|nr:NADH dehydrogenase subunit 6 [Epeurysa nawaii]QBZ38001.1 NADH dehydrogenase subunit 6 [Epeurysa nawaii]QBZ38014.1 NADH dehydrogenase subunit 6 [Epeurysa nawaii]